MEVQWRAFPLHPEIPPEGVTLERLFAGRNVDIPGVLARLKKAAEEAGLPLGERKMSFNSRLAQELGKWAEEKGRGDEFHDAVFRAYFVGGKNIGKKAVLIELAKKVRLPGKEAGEILESRAFREAVDADWKLCMEMGITAVPTFMIDHQSAVGAQPYEVLEQFLENNGVEKRGIRSQESGKGAVPEE